MGTTLFVPRAELIFHHASLRPHYLSKPSPPPPSLPAFPRSDDGRLRRPRSRHLRRFGVHCPLISTSSAKCQWAKPRRLICHPRKPRSSTPAAACPPARTPSFKLKTHTKVGEAEIEVLKPVGVGENIVKVGEDVAEGEVVLPAGHQTPCSRYWGLLALGIILIRVACAPARRFARDGGRTRAPGSGTRPRTDSGHQQYTHRRRAGDGRGRRAHPLTASSPTILTRCARALPAQRR
jgi:molybdopterin molybdotransferase